MDNRGRKLASAAIALREVFGTSAAAWDSSELQAISLAEFDSWLRQEVRGRLEQRWSADREVVRQLCGAHCSPA